MAKKTNDAAGMWERIDRMREEAGMTWRDLAKRTGKNPTQMAAAKSGGGMLRSDILAKVAKALGTSSDYLLTGEGQAVVEEPAPNMLTAFVAEVERSKIVEWAEAQPPETRPTMVEIARALEAVHVETSASGGYFYSTSDGVPVRDWGALFEALRDGRLGPTLSAAAAKVRGGPFAKKR